jgi:hypothetical protein
LRKYPEELDGKKIDVDDVYMAAKFEENRNKREEVMKKIQCKLNKLKSEKSYDRERIQRSWKDQL